MLQKEKEIYNIEIEQKYIDNTETSSSLSNEDYDILLSENIVFLDLYDSSANNAVIECIARATPLLVNNLVWVIKEDVKTAVEWYTLGYKINAADNE